MSEKILISAFTAMRDRFLRMAMHILPNEDDAADALQDAFLRLWPQRDSIGSRAEAEALTTTTLRNICIDNVRRRKIETVPINEEHDSCEEHGSGLLERYYEVRKLIEKELTPQQREVIELKDIQGYSIGEIAKRLSSTEGAVRMNLSRARRKIRECYRKEAGYEKE